MNLDDSFLQTYIYTAQFSINSFNAQNMSYSVQYKSEKKMYLFTQILK